MQSIGQNLGDNFHGAIEKRERSKIRDASGAAGFTDQCYGGIDALQTDTVVLKTPAKFIEILFDCWPTLFDEFI